MPEYSHYNACGLIAVTANLWPQAVDHYVKCCLDQTISVEELVLMQQAQMALSSTTNPIGVKYALCQMGMTIGTTKEQT